MTQIERFKDLFPNSVVARYNLTAWESSQEDNIVFVGRQVEKAGEFGEPDIGKLILFEFDQNYNIVRERIIWQPQHEGFSLEDPRALLLPDNNIIIGLTAVLKSKSGFDPFPAIVRIPSVSSWKEMLPPVTLIQTFGPGKNLTPIDQETFLFRPDSLEYYHKLLVFKFHDLIPTKLSDINFPTDLPWALWRIGTTMSPIWITPTEALLIIHGIVVEDGKYIYSIGRAKLSRDNDNFKVEVAPDPIITPNTFTNSLGEPLIAELRPNERKVVYSCGGIIKRKNKDEFSLYVNVGDRTTFEVIIPLSQLKEGLFT